MSENVARSASWFEPLPEPEPIDYKKVFIVKYLGEEWTRFDDRLDAEICLSECEDDRPDWTIEEEWEDIYPDCDDGWANDDWED